MTQAFYEDAQIARFSRIRTEHLCLLSGETTSAEILRVAGGPVNRSHSVSVMPRSKPTPDELERGTSQAIDTVTTLLRNLSKAQGELVEAARAIGMSWNQIAELTGKSSGDAARDAHNRWKAGQ